MAAMAASATSAGPSVSGKPWPRLIDPVRAASTDISLKIVVLKGWRWAPMPLRMGPEPTGTGSGLRQLAPHGAVGVAVAVDVDVEGGRVGDEPGGGVTGQVEARLRREGGFAGGEGRHEVDDDRAAGPLGALVDVGLRRLLPHRRREVVAALRAGDVDDEGADAVLDSGAGDLLGPGQCGLQRDRRRPGRLAGAGRVDRHLGVLAVAAPAAAGDE